MDIVQWRTDQRNVAPNFLHFTLQAESADKFCQDISTLPFAVDREREAQALYYLLI